jgi:hypothetical protein
MYGFPVNGFVKLKGRKELKSPWRSAAVGTCAGWKTPGASWIGSSQKPYGEGVIGSGTAAKRVEYEACVISPTRTPSLM